VAYSQRGGLDPAGPDPLAGFKGPTSKGRELREGKEGEGKGRKRKGEGEGRGGIIAFHHLLSSNALATVPSRRYRSLAATVPSSHDGTVPSRLDGTVTGKATTGYGVVNTISFSLSVTRLVLTPALTLNDPLRPVVELQKNKCGAESVEAQKGVGSGEGKGRKRKGEGEGRGGEAVPPHQKIFFQISI